MRILTFTGTHRDIGRAFGEACRDEIQSFYSLRVNNALLQAKQYGGREVTEAHLLGVARRSLDATRAYDPAGFEELEGIAAGADLSVAKILAMNGLTDFRDVLAWNGVLEEFGGCSSAIVQKDASRTRHALCGQTWDLAIDNMFYVLGVVRKPDGAPATRCLTTVGCLSLIGMNEHGIAIGTTNVRTTDARPGVTYLSIIHKALAQRTLEDAAACVTDAPRAGAHYYYLVDGEDHAVAIETTAERVARVDVTEGFYVHTNHCLVPEHARLEGNQPSGSSHRRLERLKALLEEERPSVDLSSLERFFADTENGEDAICRDHFGGISSNGAVVMEPATRTLRACHGMPNQATWVELEL